MVNIKLFNFSKNCKAVPHRVVAITKNNSKELIKYLGKCGIGVRALFTPMNSQPAYNIKEKFKNSEYLFNHGICLPSAPKLKNQEINYVISKIKKFYEKN